MRDDNKELKEFIGFIGFIESKELRSLGYGKDWKIWRYTGLAKSKRAD